CPGCKERQRAPGDRRDEVSDRPSRRRETSRAPEDREDEETFSFSRSGLLKALVWYVCFQLLAFVVMVGAAVGCVFIVLKEPLSFKMVLGVAFAGLGAVAGLCYFLMALPNCRLFFFSTIPSSSCYLVTSDRLLRYSRADKVVEEVPFENIADVRLV